MTSLDPRYLKIKAFAIYFVIAAHCTYNNNLFQQITDIIGTIGVPLFLFVSGVFFKKIKSIDQINNKTKRIVIPWLIWGGITYFLHILKIFISHGSIDASIMSFAKWILGYKTWLYFVPVLIFCILLFNILDKDYITFLFIAVNLVSLYLYNNSYFTQYHITNCQNPLNWIGFFTLGRLMDSYTIHQFFSYGNRKKYLYLITISLFFAYLIYCINYNIKPSYWNVFSIPFEVLSSCTIILFSFYKLSHLCIVDKIINNIGLNTYILYFAHMQFGNNIFNFLTNNSFTKMDSVFLLPLVFVRPVIILIITYFIFCYIPLTLFNTNKLIYFGIIRRD